MQTNSMSWKSIGNGQSYSKTPYKVYSTQKVLGMQVCYRSLHSVKRYHIATIKTNFLIRYLILGLTSKKSQQ